MSTFSDEVTKELAAPLNRSHIKTREQSGRKLSYIEGWWAISEANRIFGFDGWTRETVEFKCVSEREREIGRNKDAGWAVTYIAKVRITVARLTREGCGTGHGIDRDLGQAHESAIKEAETDAMKRALMTFGNPFGLALYDKEQNGVEDEAPAPKKTETKPATGERAQKAWVWAQEQAEFVSKVRDSAKFHAWHDKNAQNVAELKEIAPEAHERLIEAIDAAQIRFNPMAA